MKNLETESFFKNDKACSNHELLIIQNELLDGFAFKSQREGAQLQGRDKFFDYLQLKFKVIKFVVRAHFRTCGDSCPFLTGGILF
jgi:hypothetical protein